WSGSTLTVTSAGLHRMADSRRAAGAVRTAWRVWTRISIPGQPSSAPPVSFRIPTQRRRGPHRGISFMRLQGKCAGVTGAASGMGRAGVELFLREGARVAAIDINGTALAGLTSDFKRKKASLQTLEADLSDASQARQAIEAAAHKLGAIDVLWAHAGSPGP